MSRGVEKDQSQNTRNHSRAPFLVWIQSHARQLVLILLGGLIVAAVILLGSGKITTSLLAAPLPTTTVTVAPTPTPNPCAPQSIGSSLEPMDSLMAEFYDASALASNSDTDHLVQIIPSLQDIRRRANAQKVLTCLEKLQGLQVAYMNTVINTLLAWLGKSDTSVLINGVAQARLLNEEYKSEEARLRGVTYTPPTAPPTTLPTSSGVSPTTAQLTKTISAP